MDRLNQLRGEAGPSRDSTLDTSSPPSEAYMTANESSSKYFSLSEVDSTFDISPTKDESISSTTEDTERTIADSDQLISNLSPIGKKSDFLDGYKIGKQIEAANILSGGVDIFDDNENSYDGDELVIDDNVEPEEKSDAKVGDSSQLPEDDTADPTLTESEPVPTKNTEVILQIDGKNVDAIDIGNGLYLYRKAGEEELAAVQIIDDDQQQPSLKFLKVRENDEGNLEVYEEIQIEVPKEVPIKKGKVCDKSVSHVPIKDINKVISDSTSNKIAERKNKTQNEQPTINVKEPHQEISKEPVSENKTEVNVNGKMIKFSESRKSPVVGSFTPMAYHSTPNKEGIPLTKTMVDKQLHPSRHSDNIKKTIEVHTDSAKQKTSDEQNKLPNELSKEKIIVAQENVRSLEKNDQHEVIETAEGISKSNTINEETKTQCVSDKNDGLTDNNPKLESTSTPAKAILLPKEGPILAKKIETETQADNKKSDLPVVNKDVQKIDNDKKELPTSNEQKGRTEGTGEETYNKEQCALSNVENKNTKPFVQKLLEEKSEELSESEKTDLNKNSSDTSSLLNVQLKQGANVTLEENTNTTENNPEKSSEPGVTAETELPKDQNIEIDNIDKSEFSKIPADLKIDSALPAENILKDNTDLTIVEKKNIIDTLSSNENKALKSQTDQLKKTCKETNDTKESPQNVKKFSEIVSAKCVNTSVPELTSQGTKENAEFTKKTISNTVESMKEMEEIVNSNPIILENENKKIPVPSKSNDYLISLLENKESNKLMSQDKKPATIQTLGQIKDNSDKKALPKITDSKSNSNVAVPFGKWTEANRQAFLNKIKETKVPINSSNSKQIKNSNDLNRRDVLKKIDSQRQGQATVSSSKVQDFGSGNRLAVKKEASVFSAKPSAIQDTKIPVKSESATTKTSSTTGKKVKQESVTVCKSSVDSTNNTVVTKKEDVKRKEINNQDLIDKTIEDIINRGVKNNAELDDLEIKMNELHGIPFVERPDHELPKTHNPSLKMLPKSEPQKESTKQSKIPNLLPFGCKPQQKGVTENTIDVDSEEEVIEHEPITGDMDHNKKNANKLPPGDKQIVLDKSAGNDNSKKGQIITETEFDKFARRNSISYENYITVNFEGKEPHNVIQTVKQKDVALKTYSRKDVSQTDSKKQISQKHESLKHNITIQPNQRPENPIMINDNDCNKNYQSKVKMAYQTAITAKRQSERPITIIEDKPVKVVFMDTTTEYIPSLLNAQGKELSPSKKPLPNIDMIAASNSDSLDSDILESVDDGKLTEETKTKPKHQRKQVLTPVENPELELIEPDDLGIDVSPKKKRKTEEKNEKASKNMVPKKTYLHGRETTAEETLPKPYDLSKTSHKEVPSQEVTVSHHKNTASAIDDLVKAAELLETQSPTLNIGTAAESLNPDSQQNTPVKRGRGRPRKYPLPDGSSDKTKTPSPQKKPRLIDAKKKKVIDTDDDDDTSSDEEIIKENWTMGKINENIVCPICYKLFRSENVVFKHVKHCTGPSPNRLDSDNRSPRRLRESQDSDSKYQNKHDKDEGISSAQKEVRKKRKSRDVQTKSIQDKEDVIVIEDTPVKNKPDSKKDEVNHSEPRKITAVKSKLADKGNKLICEICGKTFRQLSYLINHRMQHDKEDIKKNDNEAIKTNKSVFSCLVCKKEFRKLHHLVQHRIIHNPVSATSKLSRKNSAEQSDKTAKEENISKENHDTSAGFRCEPCDKSFRKLHHLVEHRETHDGINRQKNPSSTTPAQVEKLPPPPQCDICKKTFRKLHHLVEHKEQHMETSSEKSDDKSVKSSLSTKDIIHECPLCYMVFPNEHSLNKHHIICQRKKRQSSTKQIKQTEESDKAEEDKDTIKHDEDGIEKDDDVTIISDDVTMSDKPSIISETEDTQPIENEEVVKNDVVEKSTVEESLKCEKDKDTPKEPEIEQKTVKDSDKKPEPSIKLLKSEDKEIEKVQEMPKKKLKDKVAPTVTKRHKPNPPTPAVENKPAESSDDDEIRYMLNPDYKEESELFMKVRSSKRNSLQIERPNSKDLVKRRISLQHPPKVPRLKPKPIQTKKTPTNTPTLPKNVPKAPKLEPLPSTDSDDSDVKYSFPKTPSDKITKPNTEETPSKEVKKSQRKSMAEKRKSLSGIAKRKSIGKIVGGRCKAKLQSPMKLVKKRTACAEHRCDCGQLFSSAALLARHVTLAHTPPRIRRRRSPPPAPAPPAPPAAAPPDVDPAKPARKSVPAAKSRPSADSRKSSTRSDAGPSNPARKSSVTKVEPETPERRKSMRTDRSDAAKTGPSTAKGRRPAAPVAHRGVPAPEKMRKLMEKIKK